MKRILFSLILFFPVLVFAQLQDDFADGDFTNSPAWSGDAGSFIVNTSQQLQLNATVAGTSYLYLSENLSSLNTTEWKFWIHMANSPSSGNFCRVFLVSDQSNLNGPLNGYYLQFGESGSADAVELFKKSGTTSTSVCRGTDSLVATPFSIGVRVTRDASGLWSLYVDPTGSTNYVLEATGTDATFNASYYFGVLCTYTVTYINDSYFDDFSIPSFADIIPPTIISSTAISSTQLDVLFSEAVDQTTAETASNYLVDLGIGVPTSATRDGSNLSLVHLQFANSFASATTYTVTVNNVNDAVGNTIIANSTSTFTYAPDITPPTLASATAISATELDVLFSESVDLTTAQTILNYSVDNTIGNPSSALRDASSFNLVHLTFTNSFAGGTTYTLTVNNVKDLASNTITSNATTTFTYSAPSTPVPNDVVITEFAPDPDPVVGLPDAEYVEIYNRSNKTFDLSGWKFSDSGSPVNLGSYILMPDSFLILCSTTTASLFSSFTNVLGISSFPSLNNTGGDDVVIYDNNSIIIDKIHYDETWYRDAAKADGGWSIERIDPEFTCNNEFNWKASVDPSGGTPGRVNSVNGTFEDITSPKLLRACLDDSLHVTLFFSEPVADTSLSNTANYLISESDILYGNPSAAVASADGMSATLTLTSSASGGIWQVVVSITVADCAGNGISNSTARFATPVASSPNDIVINEVLFSVDNGAVEFTELFNQSQNIIDLSTLSIHHYSITSMTAQTPEQLSVGCYLMFPDEYLVLSDDAEKIKSHYVIKNADAFLDMSFPDLLAEEDIIVLTNNSDVIIDSLHFYSSWNFPLLNDVHNISLERLSPSRATNDPQNWHSASEYSGFATPGYKNSQYDEASAGNSDVTIEPEVFSPDNDGKSDVVNILFHFDTPGYLANVKVFDSKGRSVRTLIENQLLGNDGTFSWDGVNDDREKSRTGIYVFYIEVFNINGDVKKYKKTCVLATKL